MRASGTKRVAAVTGAACLLVAALVPAARAQSPEIPVYEAAGRGQALGLQFAFTPSIFDPLLDLGVLHAESRITSQGAGAADAVAALLYPGSLVVGGAGCAGLPGSPWVQAYHPRPEGCPERQEATLIRPGSSNFDPAVDPVLNAVLERVRLTQGHLLAETDHGVGTSIARFQNLALGVEQGGAPAVEISDLRIESLARLENRTVGHRTAVHAKDVTIVGVIRIGSIISVAETSSDGTLATADGSLTILDATATVGDATYRITIDDRGIRVTDPAVDRQQRIGVRERIDDALLSAGLELVVGEPVEIVEETKGEASVGGLILAVKGAVPAVSVPGELAPVIGQVIEQIPTRCLNEFGAPLPLCFGAGSLPGPGSAVRMSIAIASASSLTVGARPSFAFDPGTGGGTADPGGTGIDPGAGAPLIQPAPGPVVEGGGPASPPPQPPPRDEQQPRAPLVGLVARLPAAALLWSGAGLLVLALALGFGPSLRHA